MWWRCSHLAQTSPVKKRPQRLMENLTIEIKISNICSLCSVVIDPSWARGGMRTTKLRERTTHGKDAYPHRARWPRVMHAGLVGVLGSAVACGGATTGGVFHSDTTSLHLTSTRLGLAGYALAHPAQETCSRCFSRLSSTNAL